MGKSKRYLKLFFCLLAISMVLYGVGRLYFSLTGGFTEANILADFPHKLSWEIRELSPDEKSQVAKILKQKFSYLGKGCQSYVFVSQDGNYVIKFMKYQRFRPKPWLDYLTFIPGVESHLQNKIKKKEKKLDNVFRSWKLASEELRPETGTVYVHLNQTTGLFPNPFIIEDKMGWEHRLDLDRMQFLVQKKAKLLCPFIQELVQDGRMPEAESLLDKLIALIMSEFKRGYADNDHALMQNTGVFAGQPIHIDVGQFVHNHEVQNPQIYKQELFSKTWKFRLWLRKKSPGLADHLEGKLIDIIGEDFWTMKPQLNKASMGRIPNSPDTN